MIMYDNFLYNPNLNSYWINNNFSLDDIFYLQCLKN